MSGRINLLAPEIRANPYPAYAELRRNAPVSQVDPGGLWAVSRQEDVMHVFKNPQIFSSQGFRQAYRPPWISNYPLADSALVMDPPQHTQRRTLINRAFGTQVVTRIEPRVREFAQRIVQALPNGQEVNFVEHFSVLMPMYVLGDLLGLSTEVQPRLLSWVEWLGQFTGVGPADTERQEAVRATVNEARGHFEQVLAERRRNPGDDLISDLLRARVEGESLSDTDLLGFMFLLLVGGMETTIHLLSHSALRLQLQPELMRQLREQPSLVPRFIDEVLRHETPAHGVMRLTSEETVLGGVRLPKGARLLMLMGSANRDEAQHPDPDRFDMNRPSSNLPFGHGIHFCVGSQLARLEARLSLEALLSRFTRLTAGAQPIQWNSSLIVRGPARLPLVPHES
ncbi:cytochrome P450 [Cystobacter ferrugineus]|uniref:Cytochrome n=1 Tax=Cystobacter ferrugineus TaxID=83449 RepID=A0A1L9AV32_9BACT|nr:cytochrome P450 [Cystobacter ferrugineus]OJH33871.1 cytochrome [Cystobacter ferrugineus]